MAYIPDNTGTTLYVDGTYGNDASAIKNSSVFKYQTISAAVSVAVSGELIYVMPGFYFENINLFQANDLYYYFMPDTFMLGATIQSIGYALCNVFGYGSFYNFTSIIDLQSSANVFVECNRLEQISGGTAQAPIRMRGFDTLEVVTNYMKTTDTGACIRIEASGTSKSFVTVREEMLGRALDANFGSNNLPYLKLVANRITNDYGTAAAFSGTIANINRGDINIYCDDMKDNSVFGGNGNDRDIGSFFFQSFDNPYVAKANIVGNLTADNITGVWTNRSIAVASFQWKGNITTPNSCTFRSFNDGTGPCDATHRFTGNFKGVRPPVTVGGIGTFELAAVGTMKMYIDGTVENTQVDSAGISKSNDPAIQVVVGEVKILTTVFAGTAPALNSVTALDTYKTIHSCARQQPNINMTNSIVGSVDYQDITIQ